MASLKILGENSDYLADEAYLDFQSPWIAELIQELFPEKSLTDEEIVTRVFHYVSDAIAHSWDIQQDQVTIGAEAVWRAKHGICYAKANLFAALTRSQGIPTGFCYQRLVLFEESNKFCIHALNAVQLNNRWVRVDARGGKRKPALNLTQDTYVFEVEEALGEVNYAEIYVHPHPTTMQALIQANGSLEMYRENLPEIL